MAAKAKPLLKIVYRNSSFVLLIPDQEWNLDTTFLPKNDNTGIPEDTGINRTYTLRDFLFVNYSKEGVAGPWEPTRSDCMKVLTQSTHKIQDWYHSLYKKYFTILEAPIKASESNLVHVNLSKVSENDSFISLSVN